MTAAICFYVAFLQRRILAYLNKGFEEATINQLDFKIDINITSNH